MKKIFYSIIAVAIFTSCNIDFIAPDYNNLSKEDFELEIMTKLDSTKVTPKMITDVISDIEYIYDSEAVVQEIADKWNNLSYDERNLELGSKEWNEWHKTRAMLDNIGHTYVEMSVRYDNLREFFPYTFQYMMDNRIEKARNLCTHTYYTKFNII